MVRDHKSCILCGEPNTESQPSHRHHIYFGSMKSNWQCRYLPEYAVLLCLKHHEISKDCPHINNDLFLKKLAKKIEIPPLPENKPFPGFAELAVILNKQLKQAIKDTEWDDTIEPDFIGRDENGNDIYMRPTGRRKI